MNPFHKEEFKGDEKNWLMIRKNDKTKEFRTGKSALTGRTLEQIKNDKKSKIKQS